MRCFGILVENQVINTKWNVWNRRHYESKGYKFTGYTTDLQVDAKHLSKGSGINVNISCDYCGDIFERKFQDYIKVENGCFPHACDKCVSKNRSFARIKKNAERQIKRFNDWCKDKGYKPITTEETYNGCKIFQFECPIHGKQIISSDHMNQRGGCKYCLYETRNNKFKITPEEVKRRVESKNNNKLLNPDDYINTNEKNLRVICGKCKKEFITSLSSIEHANGKCKECGEKAAGELNRFIPDQVESIVNSVNDNILLNKEDYIDANTKNLKVLCGCCGKHVFTVSLGHYKTDKNRCDYCKKSISDGELKIHKYLQDHNIDFEAQKRYSDCKDKKTLPFDVYVPIYNCCIEFDGPQHYYPIRGYEQLKKTQFHDKMKNQYCLDNNIKLIRIPYFYINQNEINQILDEDLLGITETKPIKLIPKYRTK